MTKTTKKKSVAAWGNQTIEPGRRKRLKIEISESFSGSRVQLPVMVWRGLEDGPVLGITSAVHGDEINGTGAILRIVDEKPFELRRGSLIMVPVVNVLGFERHSRYSPDRRDLNRSFPGSANGSLTARLARLVFEEIVDRCDYLVDLHTAAVRRTNFPNVRADYNNPDCHRLASVFGCEVIVDGKGPEGSLRRTAVEAGCPAIVIEAGEVWKVEPSVQELTLRGITNVLGELGMVDDLETPAPHQVVVEETRWVRAGNGGFLKFHVAPGDTVSKGQTLATNTGLLGDYHEAITSAHDGLVLGMTTMPAVGPGDPVAQIALPRTAKQMRQVEESISDLEEDTIETQVREHLATNISVIEIEESP